MQEEKLRERISLLMRFFWLEDLFKIGKELRLPFFDSVSHYWKMNQYQAAAEIANNVDDNKLLSLTKKHIPRYGLRLGGFHGRYYTATETGELKFEDSHNLIKANVRKALSKWGDKAYGILRALVIKKGKSTYFELIDEIERVLGYEYVPSYLLPRLGPMKLVFKTGSNKYPDWTMPSEIIPTVENELTKFKRPVHVTRPRTTLSQRLLKMERDISSIVNEIVSARRSLNLIFASRYETKLFKQNESAITDIRKLCSNEEEFNNRILCMALLIDGIETKNVKGLIKHRQPKHGSVNIIEAFLEEVAPNYDRVIIRNLRIIISLRSKKYPVHPDHPKFLDALKGLGFEGISLDWQELWEKVLLKYLESLQKLLRTFKSTS